MGAVAHEYVLPFKSIYLFIYATYTESLLVYGIFLHDFWVVWLLMTAACLYWAGACVLEVTQHPAVKQSTMIQPDIH